MKIKQLFQWQILTAMKSMAVFYLIIYLTYIVLGTMVILINENVETVGISFSSGIFLFVSSIVFFVETLRFGLANGISRKTMLCTQALTILSMSLVMSLIDLFNNWFFALITGMKEFNAITMLYGSNQYDYSFWGENTLVVILCNLAVGLIFATAGYFAATLNYRMGKLLRLVVYIGVPAILVVGLPALWQIISVNVQQTIATAFGNVLGWFGQSPYNPILIFAAVSIILYGFGILLVRRISLKTT